MVHEFTSYGSYSQVVGARDHRLCLVDCIWNSYSTAQHNFAAEMTVYYQIDTQTMFGIKYPVFEDQPPNFHQ